MQVDPSVPGRCARVVAYGRDQTAGFACKTICSNWSALLASRSFAFFVPSLNSAVRVLVC